MTTARPTMGADFDPTARQRADYEHVSFPKSQDTRWPSKAR